MPKRSWQPTERASRRSKPYPRRCLGCPSSLQLSVVVAERQRAAACRRSMLAARRRSSAYREAAMQLNGAAKSFVYEQRRTEGSGQSNRSVLVDHNILDRAAEALYEFVFSGCHRLDGKRRWADCDEETKGGFRREASAVLDVVVPLLFLHEIQSSQRDRMANRSALLKLSMLGASGARRVASSSTS